METKPIGLYVHIPFCKRKCNYCDFCSKPADEEFIALYIKSLIKEIESYKGKNKIKLDTVFIGGGTPSILNAELFEKTVDAIRENFDVMPCTEFTVEVNPGTLDEIKIQKYKKCGVNRISIGLQSIHENETKTLGRIHSFDEFKEAYSMVKNEVTDNINVDLMYGIPYQTKKSFEETLSAVKELSPAHISVYGLIIEEGTPFFDDRKKLPLPTEDDECDMYALADEYLSSCGYTHYEISNYAKDGMESKHNLRYWKDEEYIGVGIAAHSYYQGERYHNTDNFSEYFSTPCVNYKQEGTCKKEKDPSEYAMLALRLSEGFSLLEYKKLFGKDFAEGKEELLALYMKEDLLKIEKDRIFLTSKGFYLSNTIMAELIDFTT